jgi:hypothetical protein
MRKATLPVRYEIEKTANTVRCRIGFFDEHADKSVDAGGDGAFIETEYTTASGAIMKQICSTVQSLGGWNPRGIILDKSLGVTARASGASGTYAPIISLRLGSTFCRGTINPLNIDIANKTSGAGLFVNYEVRLYDDSTHLTAPTFAAPVTGSIAETDIVGTAAAGFATNPYIVLGGGVISTSQRGDVTQFENTSKIVSNIAGTSKVVTICATSTGVAQDLLAHFSWQEII